MGTGLVVDTWYFSFKLTLVPESVLFQDSWNLGAIYASCISTIFSYFSPGCVIGAQYAHVSFQFMSLVFVSCWQPTPQVPNQFILGQKCSEPVQYWWNEGNRGHFHKQRNCLKSQI